ncbi:unnamed protein product [Cyclocybe aegerita]|uniref:Uncharacterized protein n=1 Tax=Cyclocybe aegerita TaxID=1973307 RepID=A0A8S0W058_CYCAE|nr:unnamed protein product [Cyclocybe aegerita]
MSVLILDDTDPSIVYTGRWNRAGSSNEFNRTTTWTLSAGASARLSFRGTAIGVFGTISTRLRSSREPESTYRIDGGDPVTFRATQTDRTQFTQQFFQSPLLPDGEHTLEITHPETTEPVFLDFFRLIGTPIEPSSISSASSASTSASISSTTDSASSIDTTSSVSTTSTIATTSRLPITVTVTATPSASSIQAATAADSQQSPSSSAGALGATSGSSSSANAGAIIGGVLGGMVFLFLLIFGLMFWRRRRRGADVGRTKSIVSFFNRPPATPGEPFVLRDPPRPDRPPMTQATGNMPGYGYDHEWQGGYAQSLYGNAYPSSTSVSAYGQAPQTAYGTGGYLPPSQLVKQHNEANRMPNYAATTADYGYGYGVGLGGAGMGKEGRTRVRLD